jgi:hypothetical protein
MINYENTSEGKQNYKVSYTKKETPNLANVKIVVLDDGKGNLQYCKPNKTINFLILHREDGPAIDYKNSYKAHYKDGLLHGTVEFAGKICSTWKNGVKID